MSKILICISVETIKFYKSKIPLISMLALSLVPFAGGFFMFILKDPTLAQNLGFISAKASIIGTADWPSYFMLLSQAIAIGGLVVFGFVFSWIFGREYSDRTIKDLLALPMSRDNIVFSKFIVAVIWCLILSMFVLFFGLIVGIYVDIPFWTREIIIHGTIVFILCSILTILVSIPVAFFASIGHGYLSPLGFMIFTLVLAQIVAATGYGHLFPWAIPAVASGIEGNGSAMIGEISIVIVLITFVIGFVGTILWWRYADHY